jgi:hypothetical protein
MSKGGLTTNLIGRKVVPLPSLFRLWPRKEKGLNNAKRDDELELSDLEYTEAEIVAAWVEKDGGSSSVKIACVSPTGDAKEFYLTLVKVV